MNHYLKHFPAVVVFIRFLTVFSLKLTFSEKLRRSYFPFISPWYEINCTCFWSLLCFFANLLLEYSITSWNTKLRGRSRRAIMLLWSRQKGSAEKGLSTASIIGSSFELMVQTNICLAQLLYTRKLSSCLTVDSLQLHTSLSYFLCFLFQNFAYPSNHPREYGSVLQSLKIILTRVDLTGADHIR